MRSSSADPAAVTTAPESSAGAPPAALPTPPSLGSTLDLRVKLVWLTAFRLVAITLLLGVIAVRLLSQPQAELSTEDSFSFVLIGLVYLLTLLYGVLLRGGQVGPASAYVQVSVDIVLASSLVYLTGGPESPFAFTYSLAVVAAAILLPSRGALLTALASALAFTALVSLTQLGWLRPSSGSSPLSTSRAIFAVVSNGLAQLLIAVLAGYLARQLSAAGGRLKDQEADLERLGNLQRQILSCMPSGLITCDAAGIISYVNPAAKAILGRVEGAVGRPLDELIPGLLGKKAVPPRSEVSVQTPAGERRLGLTMTPLAGDEGVWLIVFQDLSELRRAEEELKRADQLAALGKFSAQLAHEIRNPLASMRGSAQMLAEEAKDGSAAARLTNILIRESDRLGALVEEFLRFARPPAPALQACWLKQLVSETVDMLRADPLARGLTIEVDGEDRQAMIDPAQIRQVLINLLRNAFVAVAPSGTVRVTVSSEPEGPRIGVWDSGKGIAAADLPRLFEPFFTTRSNGVGLGLSTAQSIVHAHGGFIRVRSSPGAGTEFMVGFPAVEGAQ